MKNYQIILCENVYIDKNTFLEREACEIGSSTSSFAGKAFDVVFYTKIDGTHELSFNLPRYYLDQKTGEMVLNELVEYVTNKNKIILKDLEEKKEYHFVVNNRTDADKDGVFSYSYACSDAFIEELAKTGYGLTFSDEVGGKGLGTIHELAEEILKDSDWEYDREKTGKLLEYSTEIEYNPEQRRYDTKYIPKPVHPIEYVEEVDRYCNKLNLFRKVDDDYRPIYCYEDTEQVVSSTVQNLIYNADDFVDLSGWTSFSREDGKATELGMPLSIKRVDSEDDDEQTIYCLQATGRKNDDSCFLFNDTAADSNKFISANQPYLFKYEVENKSSDYYISSIRIFDKNPLTNTSKTVDELTVYKQNGPKDNQDRYRFEPNKYYTIKTKNAFSKPYFAFGIHCKDKKSLIIKSFSLFEVKGKQTENITAEENNLELILNLPDKKIPTQAQLEKMHFPQSETALSAYTHKKALYFYRNEDEDKTVTYLSFTNKSGEEEEWVNSNENYYYDEKADEYKKFNPIDIIDKINSEKIQTLPAPENLDGYVSNQEWVSKVYYLSTDGKYYQYYQIEKDGVFGGAWDLALYGDGKSDKRRTLIAKQSNRFNLLQELSELFKVWCVFDMTKDDSGKIVKKVWFKENAINKNFSGFHKGVNLHGLERSADSENIVTKMFVEDIESDYAPDGFVTIRTANMNPWGENYFYNFKYYVDQYILDGDIIENDLNKLYSNVKGYNAIIFELNDKIASAKVELNNLSSMLKSISYCIASLNERIASIDADLYVDTEKKKENTKISKTDRKQLKRNRKTHVNQRKKYNKQRSKLEKEKKKLEEDLSSWEETTKEKQKKKEKAIHSFEKKYCQYIKEGVWSDNSYIDNNAYYLDAQKVSNTSAMPNTSWSISVIDGSVLEDLEDFKFSVGDQTILVDNDFFGIQPNAERNYVFEVLISGIRENLDDKTKNEIEVRNYLTSFEDIFQRISAATQTLELNEQTYDKAAYFSADGTVDKDIFQNTLLNNSLILANSADNSYVLDENGLSLQSLINPAKKMRAIADGLFFSNSTGLDGQSEWKTGITAEGINASVITSGEINTALIKIYSDGQVNFSWGAEGITSYDPNSAEDSDSFIRLDGFGLYSIRNKAGFQLDDNGTPWFDGMDRDDAINKIVSNSVFSITDKGFRLNVANGSGYVKLGYKDDKTTDPYGLYIADSKGNPVVTLQNNGDNQIAGWTITTEKLYSRIKKNNETDYLFGMQITTPPTNGSYYNAIAIGEIPSSGTSWQKAAFRVTHEGTLYAANAEITGGSIRIRNSEKATTFIVNSDGELSATGATIEGKITVSNGGKLGGWDIDGNRIESSTTINNKTCTFYLASAQSTNYDNWIVAKNGDDALFRVSKTGELYATGEFTCKKGNNSISLIANKFDDPLLLFKTDSTYEGGIMMTRNNSTLQYHFFDGIASQTTKKIPIFAEVLNGQIKLTPTSVKATKYYFVNDHNDTVYLQLTGYKENNINYYYLNFVVGSNSYNVKLEKVN